MHNLLFFIFSFLITYSVNAEKKAILIGIGAYPSDGGWHSTSGDKDVEILFNSLQKVGFKPQNITTLIDSLATYKNIKTNLNIIYNALKEEDVLYFHFSGHGQQTVDFNEDEIDNLDEALVPYDSSKEYAPGVYKGERLLTDDFLNDWIKKCLKKVGKKGQVIVTLDSCHSGTATRGTETYRGTDQIMGVVPNIKGEPGSIIDKNKNEILGSLLVFSASAAYELNFETMDQNGENIGSLSFALSKVLSEINTPKTAFAFFNRIQALMTGFAPYQTPQFEGDPTMIIFGNNKDSKSSKYLPISILNDNSIVMEGGQLMGIYDNSVVNIISNWESKDTLEARVSQTYPTLNVLSISNENADLNNDHNLMGYLVHKAPPPYNCYIKLDSKHKKLFEDLSLFIDRHEFLKSNLPSSEVIVKFDPLETKNNVAIISKEGRILNEIPIFIYLNDRDVFFEEILKTLIKSTQCKYLRILEKTSPDFDVKFEIEVINQEVVRPSSHLKIGEKFKIKVINHGRCSAYFSILGINSHNEISVLVPNTTESSEEFYIKKDEVLTLPGVYKVRKPLGRDVLKLIASSNPLRLEHIVDSNGKITRSEIEENLSEFEFLLIKSYTPQLRGLRPNLKQRRDFSTFTYFLETSF